jgi:ribonuclease HII
VEFSDKQDFMESDLWAYEKKIRKKGFFLIAGIDEAGRGPLAGPVVSAAVILPVEFHAPGLNDSKTLSPKKRENFYEMIYAGADAIGIGIVDVAEIDQINILQSALLSMVLAVKNLQIKPDFLLIDGNFVTNADYPQQAIIKGDTLSFSIAAASVMAKVTRDRIMEEYHSMYPVYGFNRHKGYPTQEHRDAIKTHGCCPIHRKTFKGVKDYQ